MRLTSFLLTVGVAAGLTLVAADTQSPCAKLTNPAAIVACEQARAGGAAAMHESAPKHRTVTVTVLRQTAASLNAAGIPGGPFGILVKTGGENCDGYSCDIICAGNGAAQRQWDVFGSVHEASTPGWDGPLSPIAVRPCEFVAGVPPDPGPPVEPPVTPPDPTPAPVCPDLSAVTQRLAVVESELRAVREELKKPRPIELRGGWPVGTLRGTLGPPQ